MTGATTVAENNAPRSTQRRSLLVPIIDSW
jgi:hypothetical protein